MNSQIEKTCFISYTWSYRHPASVINEVIRPALAGLGWHHADPRDAPVGTAIHDFIVRSIRRSHLFICLIYRSNPNVLYELGLAHAWGIPTLVMTEDIESVPFDISTKYPVLIYSDTPDSRELLQGRFIDFLSRMERQRPSLLAPSYRRYLDTGQAISIELFSPKIDAIRASSALHDVLSILDRIEPLEGAELGEVRVGSFGAWVSSNLTSITNLVEKIVFFIPEWRKKNAERVKIEAEAELLLAQADKINADAEETRRDSARKDAEALLDMIARSRNMGLTRVTIGNRLRIEADEKGHVTIGVPEEKEM